MPVQFFTSSRRSFSKRLQGLTSFGFMIAAFAGALVVADTAVACSPNSTKKLGCANKQATAKTAKNKITIDVVDADIRNVLRLFSDVGGMNFVVDEDVTGKVSLKLRNVPWDKALKAILATKGLGIDDVGGVFRIAHKSRLNAERIKTLDRYSQCVARSGLKTKMIPVNYANAESMKTVVASTLSPRGSVTVDVRTNTLIVRDVTCRR